MIQSPDRGCIIYKTKMVKVFLGSIPFYIFGLIINLLALEIYPSVAIAQSTSAPKTQQAANPRLTALEPEILSEINRVRTNPQGYAQWLEQQRQYYDGIWLRLPGEKPIRTNRGLKALQEAIAVLKKQPPLPPLDISEQTKAKATTKLDNFATANNIQNISYGRVTPQGIVMSIVVDELFPDRRRRKSLLSSNAEDTGVVCKPDPRYAKVCAIAYSDTASNTEVAEANLQTKPQPKKETIASQPKVVRAKPETAVTPEVKTPPSQPESTETAAPPEVKTPPSPTESTETAAPTVTQAPASNEDTVAESLPQPPQPPPIVPEVTTPTPEAQNNQDVEVAQAQTDKEPQAESQTKVEEPIEESASNEEAKKLEPEDSKEVATNSDSDRILKLVERGALEDGDRTIPEDGSFYDSYPLEGKSGDSLTIHLESDEFDPFVALIDDKGNIIEQNDDISEENSNSEIKVTIPEDGAYNVIVNAYDEGGKGKYILTIN